MSGISKKQFSNCILFNLEECISWALKKPEIYNIKKTKGISVKYLTEKSQKEERDWGNKMIGCTNNKQWTTKLGETLVYEILKKKNENPRKPEKKNGFEPDWETDNSIYEVKTSNWTVGGTAGEKVLGTWIKYQDIPELYNKPLKIVCVAYQEEELTNGKTNYFGENIKPKTKQILELAKNWNIHYIKFSDLVSS